VDAKDMIKCPLEWWRKHKSMYPSVGFFIKQILRFVGSQIETKRIFFLANIFTNLTTEDVVYNKKNLEKLIFLSKNWLNDVRDVDCKTFFNLVELIASQIDLEEELNKFEGSFE